MNIVYRSGQGEAPPVLPRGSRGETFGEDYVAISGRLTIQNLLESLLKKPESVVYELVNGRRMAAAFLLALTAGVCFASYGFIMGTFSSGEQLLLVPLKLLVGILFATCICLPSLYIFSCFSGGRQSIGETVGVLLLAIALWGILLVGFAPIVWLFSQSTKTVSFMGFLHLIFWLIAAGFSLGQMKSALVKLNERRLAILNLWGFLFLIVTLQVATMMRPIVGPSGPLRLTEKKFFLVHWADCMGRE